MQLLSDLLQQTRRGTPKLQIHVKMTNTPVQAAHVMSGKNQSVLQSLTPPAPYYTEIIIVCQL